MGGDAPAGLTSDVQFEITYLLLINVVGYSKLLVEQEIGFLQELVQIARTTKSFRKSTR
jgi:hypothetical protein